MRQLEKWGGIGSLVAAATFVIGLAMFATILTDYTSATENGGRPDGVHRRSP